MHAATADRPVADQTPFAMARQAIIDGKLSVFGYEMLDRSGAAGESRDAEFLLYVLSLADSAAAADHRPLFMRCSLETLATGHLDLVDAARVVLEIALPPAIDAAGIAAAAVALHTARKRGFRLSFDHRVLAPAWRSWLLNASFIRFDMALLPPGVVEATVKEARRHPAARLIACNIETAEQHKAAVDAGVKMFQGNWFARPVLVRNQTMRPGQATVLQLIHLVRTDADTGEIEAVLKRDPALSFNLLRFINSSGFGLSCEVSSFRHAVMIMGLKNLFRWAALLIATSRDGGATAVGHTAVVRGRLMELLAAELLTPEECDHAFVVGIFSLLEAMTGMPLERVLEGISLPEPVLQALLQRKGTLAPFLELTEACEDMNHEAFARAANALQLSGRQVNTAHLEALAWASHLLRD
ncbi:EAL and HDOD domain-containing protein [uncultured Ramlibacter sp.]|uniref:EAL and HDOD domain-containing protein n=1 Tax=uncultured Ramlibacter sp. TaxID=260755 RepID=UPI0026351F79|nr:HDOD domain-containing protein [uncultured Ramlibacter sp.]